MGYIRHMSPDTSTHKCLFISLFNFDFIEFFQNNIHGNIKKRFIDKTAEFSNHLPEL